MNDAYQWWLLALVIAGVIGGVWLMRGTLPRREVDVADDERPVEASWIADELQLAGHALNAEDVARVLALHRRYLEEPPLGAPAPTLSAPATVPPQDSLAGTEPDDAEPPERPESEPEFRDRYGPPYGASRTSS